MIFARPIIWNLNPTDTSDIMHFDIKGPAGQWKIRSYGGVDSISERSGTIPATITAKRSKDKRTDITIQLEYVGEEIKTQFGETIPKGKPFVFSFHKFFQPIDWTVNWFSLDTATYNPIKTGELFAANVEDGPRKNRKSSKCRLCVVGWNKN